MEKFYYDDPVGCYREGKELWRYVSTKNGDDTNSLSIESIKQVVDEENFRLISTSTDGLGSRIKSWASALRIDPNLKIFWHLKSPLKENNFRDLFKNSEMEVPILPPDFDFILYGGGSSFLILPTDDIDDDFPSLKLQEDKIKHNLCLDDQKIIDYEFERIPISIRKEYVNMFSIIKSQIRDDILIEVDSFSNNFTDKTISVHVRSGTGFTIQCAGPPEAYLFKLDETIKVMESYSDDYTFFVSTDESVEQGSNDILSTLQEKFGDRILYHERDSSSVRGALIDLLLLSKNKIIIGTYLSTFTEVAWWVGGATAKVIFPGWE